MAEAGPPQFDRLLWKGEGDERKGDGDSSSTTAARYVVVHRILRLASLRLFSQLVRARRLPPPRPGRSRPDLERRERSRSRRCLLLPRRRASRSSRHPNLGAGRTSLRRGRQWSSLALLAFRGSVQERSPSTISEGSCRRGPLDFLPNPPLLRIAELRPPSPDTNSTATAERRSEDRNRSLSSSSPQSYPYDLAPPLLRHYILPSPGARQSSRLFFPILLSDRPLSLCLIGPRANRRSASVDCNGRRRLACERPLLGRSEDERRSRKRRRCQVRTSPRVRPLSGTSLSKLRIPRRRRPGRPRQDPPWPPSTSHLLFTPPSPRSTQ